MVSPGNSRNAELDEDLDWDELLQFINEDKVVVVVGDELFRVALDGASRTLDSVFAEELARELLPQRGATPPARLADVAAEYLRNHGNSKKIYSKLKGIVDRHPLATPEPLRQLAGILDLRVFLTTNFTPLLAHALDEVRFGGRHETHVLAFAPFAATADPSGETLAAARALVYHLFGQVSSIANYVITEEDVIEFLYLLSADKTRPPNLFAHLKGRHLLLLGCGYGDWLARFFIRTLRNERFATSTAQSGETLIDASAGDDLVVFLRQYQTSVFRSHSAVEFVAELRARWDAKYGKLRPAAVAAPHRRDMPAEAVFLSYAKEDLAHVRALAAALEAAEVDVWFDEHQLKGGADWEEMIQTNIRRCSLFVPFISSHVVAAREGYFRAEWGVAIKRLGALTGSTRPFLLPVAVDDTPEGAPNVAQQFRTRQWMRLDAPDGLRAVVEQIRQLVRELRAPQFVGSRQ